MRTRALRTSPPFAVNGTFGWCAIAAGTLFGMVLGLWSFQGPLAAPAGLDDYSSLPRRLLRLSHIACIALGALNVILSMDREVGRGRAARWGGRFLLWGSMGLPPALAMGAFAPTVRLAYCPPALLVASGATLIAAARLGEGRARRRFAKSLEDGTPVLTYDLPITEKGAAPLS